MLLCAVLARRVVTSTLLVHAYVSPVVTFLHLVCLARLVTGTRLFVVDKLFVLR